MEKTILKFPDGLINKGPGFELNEYMFKRF